MSGNTSTDTIDTGVFTYKRSRNLLDNKGYVHFRKNNKTGKTDEISRKVFESEIGEAWDDYKKKKQKKMGEQVEARQSINKDRIVDNLDDLDREFCKTFDKLLALYKRIMIRAYTFKEERCAKKWKDGDLE